MELILIDLEDCFVRFACGYSVPIVGMFDAYGDDCGPEDALAIAIGPLPGDGHYASLDLAHCANGVEPLNV